MRNNNFRQQTVMSARYPAPGAHWQSAWQNARWFNQNTRWVRDEAIFSGEKDIFRPDASAGIREGDAGCEMG